MGNSLLTEKELEKCLYKINTRTGFAQETTVIFGCLGRYLNESQIIQILQTASYCRISILKEIMENHLSKKLSYDGERIFKDGYVGKWQIDRTEQGRARHIIEYNLKRHQEKRDTHLQRKRSQLSPPKKEKTVSSI